MRNESLLGALTNWEHVAGALPGKCGVSDIDGIIERNGHFLILEAKMPNEEMSLGQEIMLKRLSSIPRFTVVVVRMDNKTGEVSEYSQIKGGVMQGKVLSDTRKFSLKVAEWFKGVS